MGKLKTLTLRIPNEDYALLEQEASTLQIRPGTLARILLHASLSKVYKVPSETDSLSNLYRILEETHEP